MSVGIDAPDAAAARSGCAGAVPLPARLEDWQIELCNRPGVISEWLQAHGSPLNIIAPGLLTRNAGELQDAAADAGVELKIFFARKANKALALVDEARRSGLGVDVASERELAQVLAWDVPAGDIVVTAAVKPRPLLELCVASGATVEIDNEDELALLADVAEGSSRPVPVAFRLAPEVSASTRFGLAPDRIAELAERFWPDGPAGALALGGVHFHLDGYAAGDRVQALGEALDLVDALRERGHAVTFVDIGGGVPMSYIDDATAWELFWREHRSALKGGREALTFEGHGLGLLAHAGEIIGRPNVYPYHQALTRGPWLSEVLRGEVTTRAGRETAASALQRRDVELRCEPGRSLLDGCGLTAARVEFRKQRRDGTWLIGLAMNRTQCRTTSDDFLVDPLLLSGGRGRAAAGLEGYLVGAYCIERELLTWRRLRFPRGAEVGDTVIFPNTAGYLMHSLESASHQIPLAGNLIFDAPADVFVDAIDTS